MEANRVYIIMDLTNLQNVLSYSDPIEMTVSELLTGVYVFSIPSYQRGYRWEKKQVLQLIEDIHKFFGSSNNAAFYCLQSIVVNKSSLETIKKYNLSSNLDNNTWYEVIDGQQRLTSIHILFR